MAQLIGVSKRAFAEWMREGGSTPTAIEATLLMLSMLPNEDVLKIIEKWRQSKNEDLSQAKTVTNDRNNAKGESNG